MSDCAELRFDLLGRTYRNGRRWAVIRIRYADIIGLIDYSEWREEYRFCPEGGYAFDAAQLGEIAAFLRERNQEP